MKPRSLFAALFTTFSLGLCAVANAAPVQLAQAPLGGEIVPIPSPVPPPASVVLADPTAPVELPPPPTAQAYVTANPPAQTSYGQTMVPVTFFSNGLGASVGPLEPGKWRLLYFGRQIDFYPYQKGALFNGQQVSLPVQPQTIGGVLYVPLAAFCDFLGVKWSAVASTNPAQSQFLLQFPAAYIQDVRASKDNGKVRVVVTLSNPTRIVASQAKQAVGFNFAGARSGQVQSVTPINDYLVPHAVLQSGDWTAQFAVRLNYPAPIQWFTLGNPPRIVIDAQRLFEERSLDESAGIDVTKIRKGTGHGPVQMWAAKFDPRQGWRVKLVPAGFGVLQKARPSILSARHKAALAINGGFFAYDGAAMGAVMVNGEWIRLPWGGRTAVGFSADGKARINNLQTSAYAEFTGMMNLPIRDLNGWPDKGKVSALTRRFAPYYTLQAGEMAVVVKNGVVVSTPGGGMAAVPEGGFTLVASGGARPYLAKIMKGQKAKLVIQPIGWPNIQTALGGGPRLVKNGQIEVTADRENFRTDVKNGAGPRTAFGIDREGRYIILVADGRKKFYSTGLTLQELAATMQKLGAVDALNLDGGGSTSLAIKGKLVNHPSDGFERGVANALLVTR